jgi:hypothetical protein
MMKNIAPLVLTIMLTTASARTTIAQSRIYRSPNKTRGNRRSYEYNEQIPGQFPGRVTFLKRNQDKTHKKKIVNPIGNDFYSGSSFSVGMSSIAMNGSVQLNLGYFINGMKINYQGLIPDNRYQNYYPDFKIICELGKMNGYFGALNAGGEDNGLLLFHEDLAFGRNIIFGNNKWRFSPSIALGVIFWRIPFPQEIDNSKGDITLLGQSFPYAYQSHYATKYSDQVTLYLKGQAGELKVRGTLSPRIKDNFPIRFTIGYSYTFGDQVTLRAASPGVAKEFPWNADGVNLSSNSNSSNNLISFQGVFFEINLFLNSRHSKQI